LGQIAHLNTSTWCPWSRTSFGRIIIDWRTRPREPRPSPLSSLNRESNARAVPRSPASRFTFVLTNNDDHTGAPFAPSTVHRASAAQRRATRTRRGHHQHFVPVPPSAQRAAPALGSSGSSVLTGHVHQRQVSTARRRHRHPFWQNGPSRCGNSPLHVRSP